LEDTDDSGDFLDDEEEDEDHEAGNGKRRVKKMKKSKSPNVAEELSTLASSGVPIDTEGDAMVVDGLPLVGEHVDAPPPGVLSSLWYSREQVLHIWVVDKILGWRIRPVTSLEWSDPDAPTSLEQTEAAAISTKVLADEEFWNDQHKRAEVSRINPTHCPMVMHICAKKEAQKAKLEGREVKYELKPYETTHDTEEVFLVKWRGRSYMHCSWERKKDLEKLDPSNNNAARSKIRRYIQNQEIAHGKNWKQVLEAERGVTQTSDDGTEQPISDEEFFPSQFLEVERLLACDESQMDTSILAKQRALNIREEQQLLSEREKKELPDGMHHKHVKRLFEKLPLLSDGEDPWDPEDYVRYVVKWKGQNYSEMTWEYWINIKRDAVDLAEDFWYRQQAPDPEEIRKLPPHPHVRDFRKLTESPVFGLSKMKRPVADLGDGFVVEEEEDEDLREFRLRSYQLEGVNWLLFNWWNKRSCILADGKCFLFTGLD
jgi:chromodomain-helicase-DNA-binding protein 7